MGQNNQTGTQEVLDQVVLNSSLNTVFINMIIDTDSIINDKKTPSQDPNNPTWIEHNYAYMVATRSQTVVGSGTGDLEIKAQVGEPIHWSAVSESNNFDNSVILYKIKYLNGDHVFDDDYVRNIIDTKMSAMPTPKTFVPATYTNQSFWSTEARIDNPGHEAYSCHFGLYKRDGDGNQSLYGYFAWDPSITVKN
ncbi:inclusion body family protein [Alistipes sp. ZOR0009]|uniref:inclusion body family protein n=1 Tax=Alistipes sp. ZOR0009 TaxID=1339253 RepID=UPI00068FE544|nr:inclusion body family protein [Alistipes sp. ZOR0009]